jgi:hypothetical protein
MNFRPEDVLDAYTTIINISTRVVELRFSFEGNMKETFEKKLKLSLYIK